ncbi:MAG: hypothetical protein ACE5H1_11700 [Thermodesulfobacteriota bacterium]
MFTLIPVNIERFYLLKKKSILGLCFSKRFFGKSSFKEFGEYTEITITHYLLPYIESCDRHKHGWIGCLIKLKKSFAKLRMEGNRG